MVAGDEVGKIESLADAFWPGLCERSYEAADVRSLAGRVKQRNTADRSAPAPASPSPTDRITIAPISTSSTTSAPFDKSVDRRPMRTIEQPL